VHEFRRKALWWFPSDHTRFFESGITWPTAEASKLSLTRRQAPSNVGLTGKFNQVVDTLNTSGLTRTDVIAPNGVLVSYLRPAPTPVTATPALPASISLTTPKPLPPTPPTPAQKNAILVPIVNPNLNQLAAPFEVWFSGANIQRFNIENRFDDIVAGSTGFVSNVSYPTPPPTGKQVARTTVAEIDTASKTARSICFAKSLFYSRSGQSENQ
jgi:hypothetical protein